VTARTGCSVCAFDFFEKSENLDGYDVILNDRPTGRGAGQQGGQLAISSVGIRQLFARETGGGRPASRAIAAGCRSSHRPPRPLPLAILQRTAFAVACLTSATELRTGHPRHGSCATTRSKQSIRRALANQDLHAEACETL